MAEHVANHGELHETGPYREIQAAQNQGSYQQIGPQGIVDRCDRLVEGVKIERYVRFRYQHVTVNDQALAFVLGPRQVKFLL